MLESLDELLLQLGGRSVQAAALVIHLGLKKADPKSVYFGPSTVLFHNKS
jgi:hypothetical protein